MPSSLCQVTGRPGPELASLVLVKRGHPVVPDLLTSHRLLQSHQLSDWVLRPSQGNVKTPDERTSGLGVPHSGVPLMLAVSGELRAIQIGGRAIWRTGSNDLEG